MLIAFGMALAASLLSQNSPPAEKQPDSTSNLSDGYPPTKGLDRPAGSTRDKWPFDDLLKGPTVVEADANALTIVHHRFDGTIEDVGPEPDFVAIGLLQLTDEQRSRYDAIHAQRSAVFDQCVRSHYGLILELASLQGETDPHKRAGSIEKVREAFADYLKRGSFYEEMNGTLTEPQREQVRRMIDEHRQARIADLRRTLGEDAPLQMIAQRARADAFGAMIRQSIDRLVGLDRESFERLADELDLTPEQKSKAQAIFQPLGVKRLQGIDTPEDRIAAYAELSKILTPDQRKAALQIYARNWKPADAPATSPATEPSNAGHAEDSNGRHRPHDD